MSRLLLVPLLLAVVGCSGGTISSGPSPDTRARPDRPEGHAGQSGRDQPGRPERDAAGGAGPAHAGAAPGADRRPARPRRRSAVRAAKELRQWGKEAAPAARPLATVVATSGTQPRQAALEALEAIFPDRAADLHALVADEDPAKRIAAEKHLAGLAAPLLPIIDWRIAALPAEAHKPNVGYGLAGEEYAALAPLLLKAGMEPAGVKAVVVCATVNPEGGKALWEPAQLTLCELAKAEGLRKEALAALDSSLSSRPSVATLQAVGALGPDAKSLAPLLETLATDRDANVRKAAAEALKKVQG